MTPLNGFLEVGMYGDSAGLRLRGRCGRRGACVRTARCVRADGAVRACGRAYARCEERWKVRMGIARNAGNGGKQKKKPAAVE